VRKKEGAEAVREDEKVETGQGHLEVLMSSETE
jgi:hypothetical protein